MKLISDRGTRFIFEKGAMRDLWLRRVWIPWNSENKPRGLYFSKALFEGPIFGRANLNLRLKIDWASLIVASKFTVFALFYFICEGNFPISSPPGGLYLEGRFNGGFFTVSGWDMSRLGSLYLEGLIFRILRYVGLANKWVCVLCGS